MKGVYQAQSPEKKCVYFTKKELNKEIKELKTGRCKDTGGIVAEMVKNGGPQLLDALLELYNQVVSKNGEPPEKCKYTNLETGAFRKIAGPSQLFQCFISCLPDYYAVD